MNLPLKLRLLLVYDAIFSALILGWAYLSPYEMFLSIVVGLTVTRRLEKAIRAITTPLEPSERRTYFFFTLTRFLILLGLLLSWIIRHSSPPAWAMGSLGIIVLLTLLYGSRDEIYARNSKI